jgi:glyoxylase-like metal-dependent hydrolase (beta-lactamase superfamily II)
MTPLTRREFLEVTGAVVALGALATASRAAFVPRSTWSALSASLPVMTSDTKYFDWTELAPGVFSAASEGGNIMALVGKAESLLIDTKNCGFGTTVRREAESLGAPVRLVINTHHHADHTGGNHAFTKDIPLLAHPKAIERINSDKQYAMYRSGATGAIKALGSSDRAEAKAALADAEALVKAFPAKEAFVPTRKFSPTPGTGTAGREEITHAGEKIEITHVGAGHTDTDLIIRFPNKNVVHTGDLVFNKTWPYIDRAGGCDTAGWIKSLEKLSEMCDDKTIVIPGHGDIADKSAVTRQIAFFKDMRQRAADAVKKGTTRDEFLKLAPDEYKSYADRSKPITLGGLFDEASNAPIK